MAIDWRGLGALGFGSGSLGNLYRPITDGDAADAVRAAWQSGIRYFDTAPHYGFGLSEKRLGAALAEADPGQTAIVSTKVGRRLDPVPPGTDLSATRQAFVSPEPFESAFDYRYDAVMRSFEASLKRLQRDRIDILYCHDLGSFTHGADHPRRFAEFIDGGYRAMRELRESGAVGAIGLGVNETAICEQVIAEVEIDAILLAGRYTLLEQEPLASFFPLCEARGVRVVVGGPFNSGILATGVRGGPVHYNYGPAPQAVIARAGAIEDICAAHGVPLAAAALQFPRAQPQVACVLAGMDSAAQAEAAVALMARPIPAAHWRDLREHGLVRHDAPLPAGTIIGEHA